MSNERCIIVGFNIGRPLDHSLFAPDLTPIYGSCHSRKSINRALILHQKGGREEREGEEKGEKEIPHLLDHRLSSSCRLKMPELCRIFGRTPEYFPTSMGCWNSSQFTREFPPDAETPPKWSRSSHLPPTDVELLPGVGPSLFAKFLPDAGLLPVIGLRWTSTRRWISFHCWTSTWRCPSDLRR